VIGRCGSGSADRLGIRALRTFQAALARSHLRQVVDGLRPRLCQVFNVRMALLLPFTEVDLKAAAGPLSYDRGLDYLSQVKDLDFDGPEITATVYGSDAYEVCLTVDTGRSGNIVLVGDCSCPFGQEGNFCKHCVATGLAALKLAETRQVIPAGRRGHRGLPRTRCRRLRGET
jgi:uncharacterized Zn finger protein